MSLIHIVMFTFEPTATKDEIKTVCDDLLAMKERCINPHTGENYVTMGMGGIQNSPEGLDGGMTHIFISGFQTWADRKYYLEEDPVHLDFVQSLVGIVAKVQVVDFSPGNF